jgi:DNA-binding transcriptional ArsR family regulator
VAPLAFLVHPEPGTACMAFGVRSGLHPGNVGAEAPEELVTSLKSLGDPIRLRILKYLAREPLSPTELARHLRLRPPTVIHHLRLLRFAGLVQVIVSEKMEKRYASRPEALQIVINNLKDFLTRHE